MKIWIRDPSHVCGWLFLFSYESLCDFFWLGLISRECDTHTSSPLFLYDVMSRHVLTHFIIFLWRTRGARCFLEDAHSCTAGVRMVLFAATLASCMSPSWLWLLVQLRTSSMGVTGCEVLALKQCLWLLVTSYCMSLVCHSSKQQLYLIFTEQWMIQTPCAKSSDYLLLSCLLRGG